MVIGHLHKALRKQKIMAFILVALSRRAVRPLVPNDYPKSIFDTFCVRARFPLCTCSNPPLFLIGGVTMLQQTGTAFFLSQRGIDGWLKPVIVFLFITKGSPNLFLLLMTGMILGTLFNSISTFYKW